LTDFDQYIDRRASASAKWEKYAGRDILPFWVADMDFACPEVVQAAISNRLAHGIHGYTRTPSGLTEVVVEWFTANCQYAPHPQEVLWIPGVVPGLNLAARALARNNGAVLMNTPVYFPFRGVPANAGQLGIEVPLTRSGNCWEMDFDALAEAAANRTGTEITTLLLCNPQNPTGRVYTEAELTELAEFCLSREIVIVSDEIHCSLILDASYKHISIASLAPEVAQNCITLHGPSKAYNTAGLNSAVAIIPNAQLRQRFGEVRAGLVSGVSPFAYAVAAAAYGDRSNYLAELNAYLAANHRIVQTAVANMAGVSSTPVEGTYLAWLDARELNTQDPAAHFEALGVGLSDGVAFGGPGFVRFNFAAPRKLVRQGLDRMLNTTL
jgi:cystathionine beta-lyase